VVILVLLQHATEEYNGTAWATSPGSLNTARDSLAGCGLQTAALAFGGETGTTLNATEEYDGSTWTTVTSLSTARTFPAGAGTTQAALAMGGEVGGVGPSAITEEFTGAGPNNSYNHSFLTLYLFI
jgi:hypothetical protein